MSCGGVQEAARGLAGDAVASSVVARCEIEFEVSRDAAGVVGLRLESARSVRIRASVCVVRGADGGIWAEVDATRLGGTSVGLGAVGIDSGVASVREISGEEGRVSLHVTLAGLEMVFSGRDPSSNGIERLSLVYARSDGLAALGGGRYRVLGGWVQRI